KCAPLETEKLAFDHIVRRRRTVERRKLLHSPRASCMQRSRYQLLTRTRLTGYQHGDVGGANLMNLLEHPAHRTAGADETRELYLGKKPRRIENMRPPVLAAKDLRLEPLFDDIQQRLHIDRAGNESLRRRSNYTKQKVTILVVTQPVNKIAPIAFLLERLEKV